MEKLICLRHERLAGGDDRRYQGATSDQKNDLYLSIADGDFAYAKAIENAVIDEVKSGNLAYKYLENKNAVSIRKFYQKQYGLDIKIEDILFGNGVLFWIQVAIHTLSQPGDGVIVMNPVYDPFVAVIKDANRKVIDVPLQFKNNHYKIDFEMLDKAMAHAGILILCSPHNPTGNVWSKEDLMRILDLAKKHFVYVLADEIWQDIILEDKFTSVLSFKSYVNMVVHIASPVKTYNIGGMQFGVAIVQDYKLRTKMQRTANSFIHYSSSQPWISRAIRTAYEDKDAFVWYQLYLAQIKKNVQQILEIFDQYQIPYSRPQSTYLIFAKLGRNKITDHALEHELVKKKLHVGMGYKYGPQYNEWVRINIAICDNSMRILKKALIAICEQRIKSW